MAPPDTPHPPRKLGAPEVVALIASTICFLYAIHIIITDAFGDPSRYSNRSMSRPAMGLALTVATYLVARSSTPSLWVRIAAWPVLVFFSYLAFGAALIGISLLFRAIA